jgi:hypothetical protein
MGFKGLLWGFLLDYFQIFNALLIVSNFSLNVVIFCWFGYVDPFMHDSRIPAFFLDFRSFSSRCSHKSLCAFYFLLFIYLFFFVT